LLTTGTAPFHGPTETQVCVRLPVLAGGVQREGDMVGSIPSVPRIDITPTSAEDVPRAAVQAEIQVAVLKTQQDTLRMQGQELARLIEPHKGNNIDTYA
jgi:hypothetical protein